MSIPNPNVPLQAAISLEMATRRANEELTEEQVSMADMALNLQESGNPARKSIGAVKMLRDTP